MIRTRAQLGALLTVLTALVSYGQSFAPPAQDYVLSFSAGGVAYTTQINLGTSFTMESWVSLDAADPFGVFMGKAYNPHGTDPFMNYVIGLDSTGLKPAFVQTTGAPGSYRQIIATADLPLHTWVHLAATLASGTMRLYVNGQLVASGASPGAPANTSVPFTVGGGLPDGQNVCCNLFGAMRKARVWSRALSQSELQSQATQKLTGTEAGLIAEWPLNEGSGTTAASLGPQPTPLTITSRAMWADTQIYSGGPYWEFQTLAPFPGVPYGNHVTTYRNASGRSEILIAYAPFATDKPYLSDDSISGPVLSYRNEGNRVLTQVIPSTPTRMVWPRNSAVADFDGDGLEDVVVADHGYDAPPYPGGITRIFMQRSGEMKDETDSRLTQGRAFTHDICAADVNRDGSPDLLYMNLNNLGPTLHMNDGKGHFKAANERMPPSLRTFNPNAPLTFTSCKFADVNLDGAPDLLLGSWPQAPQTRDWLLLNDGKGNFTDVTAQSMPLKWGGSTSLTLGFAVGDVNRDGWPDLVVTLQDAAIGSPFATMQLLINNRDGTFHEQMDPALSTVRKDAAFFDKSFLLDFNHDGWLDLVVNQGNVGMRVFQNMGGFFVERTYTLPRNGNLFNIPADVDGDGRIDLVSAANANSILWGKNLWPPVCSQTVNFSGLTFSDQGGDGRIEVSSNKPDCAWNVSGVPGWVQLTGPSAGTGNGTITFHVNASSSAASGTLTVAGWPLSIQQTGILSALPAVGSLAHVTSQGTWKFTLNQVNLGVSTTTARISFRDDNGSVLPMPLTFPQLPASLPLLAGSALDRSIAPNAQLIVEGTGPDSALALVGSGKLAGAGSLGGFGIFSNALFHWDAVVPLETRNTSKYVLAFDNTGALVTGVAVSNVATATAAIPVVIRDDTGAQIFTATINLAASGHVSFMLNAQYPATANKRGTIEFGTPTGGQISVLGLRANGPALTTLPVLASSDTPGGAIAHATYNGGFTSVFYLVNTGSASASFTLSFFDESGNALTVPLSLPQSGTTATSSTLTRTLAPGAMLVVETVANDTATSVAGSAQLTTTGNVSGFEIFRWTTFGQEASVPLETRTPNSFVLVFDDTNGLTTGVALSNIAATGATVTAKIYDDAGTLLQTAAINLAGRGHTSFLLPSNYSVTANKRGMVEFLVPSGGKINAVGLRAKADGTLTTIPVLTK